MKRILFVDDDREVMTGFQGQLQSSGRECDMRFAASGSRALELMEESPADVIVTDAVMPDMDGGQLLETVHKQHPETIRIVLSGHPDRDRGLRVPGAAHQYLAKPCQPVDLHETIARAFALRNLLSNTELMRRVSRMEALPSLPTLFLELVNEVPSGDPSMDRIGELIARDMGLSAKILRLVNSAFFGLGCRITHPTEAVIYLGLETVKSLVLSMQVFSQFNQYQAAVPEFPLELLWQHCWSTGVRARRLARAERFDPELSDHCFVSALLHDVGRLVLVANLPDPFKQALALARQNHLPLWQAEEEILGSSHAEVGAYLLGLWNFPTPVIEAVALHHRPGSGFQQELNSTTVVHVADVLDHELSRRPQPYPGSQLDLDYLRFLGAEPRLEEWSELCLTVGPGNA
jgi:HD-like signal output (HDOD) protein/CheY-like chemotaxis protein